VDPPAYQRPPDLPARQRPLQCPLVSNIQAGRLRGTGQLREAGRRRHVEKDRGPHPGTRDPAVWELLEAIKPAKGGRPAEPKRQQELGRAPTPVFSSPPSLPASRKEAAQSAGLSPHQQKTAQRVANVPEPDKRRAVETALRLRGGESDRAIAEHCGVSAQFTGDVRRQLSTADSSSGVKRIGRDGKTRTTTPAKQAAGGKASMSDLSRPPAGHPAALRRHRLGTLPALLARHAHHHPRQPHRCSTCASSTHGAASVTQPCELDYRPDASAREVAEFVVGRMGQGAPAWYAACLGTLLGTIERTAGQSPGKKKAGSSSETGLVTPPGLEPGISA
jgi:hypothetical protein